LIQHGLPDFIIESVRDKVFESVIDANAMAAFKAKFLVVNVIRKKDNFLVRYITEVPIDNAISCPASLEDAYLYLTK
jgi:hypothetical protein